MRVILEYSDEDFRRLQERAFINSRTIGEYIRKVTEYPANNFSSWKVEGEIHAPISTMPILDDSRASQGEPELYVSDKPVIIKRKKKRKYNRKVKV